MSEIVSTARSLIDRGASALTGTLQELRGDLTDALSKAPLKLNSYGFDPFGFHPGRALSVLLPSALLYRYYFRVETHDIERIPSGRVLVIANHSGQFAYDGAMLMMSMLLHGRPPRLGRGMGEYFLWKTPWLGLTAARMGTMVGTPSNCVSMLEAEQAVVVFPEGARGANKPFRQRYQLQRFGQGFMRLALQTRTPIVPIGIVGAEEQQPGLFNLTDVAEKVGLPSFPITLTSPWLGPLGVVAALPVKYRIYFGEPIVFEGEPHEEDAVIQERVDVVKGAMNELISRGLSERKGIFT